MENFSNHSDSQWFKITQKVSLLQFSERREQSSFWALNPNSPKIIPKKICKWNVLHFWRENSIIWKISDETFLVIFNHCDVHYGLVYCAVWKELWEVNWDCWATGFFFPFKNSSFANMQWILPQFGMYLDVSKKSIHWMLWGMRNEYQDHHYSAQCWEEDLLSSLSLLWRWKCIMWPP